MIRYILFLLLIFILCIYLQFKTITYETFFVLKPVSPDFLVASTGLESLLNNDFFNGSYTTSYSLTYAGAIANHSIWTANNSNYKNESSKTGYNSLIDEIYSELYNDVKAKLEYEFPNDICNNFTAYNSKWDLSTATAMGCYFNKYYEPCKEYNDKIYVWAKVSFPEFNDSNNVALNLVSDTTTILGGTLRLGYVETWVDVTSSLLHPLSGYNVTTTIRTESKDYLRTTITLNSAGTVPKRGSNDTIPVGVDSKFGKIPILHEGEGELSVSDSYKTTNGSGGSVLIDPASRAIARTPYYHPDKVPAELIHDNPEEVVSNFMNGKYDQIGSLTTIEALLGHLPNLNHRHAGRSKYDDVPVSARRKLEYEGAPTPLPDWYPNYEEYEQYKCGSRRAKRRGIYKHVAKAEQLGNLTTNLNMITSNTDCTSLSFELYNSNAIYTNPRRQKKHRERYICRGDAFAEACEKIKTEIGKQANANRKQEEINSGLRSSQDTYVAARGNWQGTISTVLEEYFEYCNEHNIGHTSTVFCSGRILIITWIDGDINWYVAANQTPDIDIIQDYPEVENAIELDIVSDITEPPSRSERIPDDEIVTLSSSTINDRRARFSIKVENLSNTCVGKIFTKLDGNYGAENVYLNDIKKANKIPTFCPVEPDRGDKNYYNIFAGDIVQFLNYSYNKAKTNMQNTFKRFSEDSMTNIVSEIDGKMQSVIYAEETGRAVNTRNTGIHAGVEAEIQISGEEVV